MSQPTPPDGTNLSNPIGWWSCQAFARAALAVDKKAHEIIVTGSGEHAYFLVSEEVGRREYIVHQWFHLCEGVYAQNEDGEFVYNEAMDRAWGELVRQYDEAVEEAGKEEVKEAKKDR